MTITTLKRHRKSSNRYVFVFGRQTVTITRRFLPRTRSVRVRITAETLAGTGEGNWTEHRDYPDMHEGDAAFNKQARDICAKWEKECIPAAQNTAPKWATDITTSRTGVKHVVGEDGRTLCQAPDAAPATRPALEGKVVGRVLGEYTVKVRRRPMGRTDAMLILLEAADAHPDNIHFQALRTAGYGPTTTWDQLGEMLPPVISTVMHGGDLREDPAAVAFLTACEPVLAFYQDTDDTDEEETPALAAPQDTDPRTVPLENTRMGAVIASFLTAPAFNTGRNGERYRLWTMCKWIKNAETLSVQLAHEAAGTDDALALSRLRLTDLCQGLGFIHLVAEGFTADTTWEQLAARLGPMVTSWRVHYAHEVNAYAEAADRPEREMLGHLIIGRRLFLKAVEGLTPYLDLPQQNVS